ncbi:unnamed protein product [Chrysoparadoxa australica]
MSDAALNKVEAEVEKLQRELDSVKEAELYSSAFASLLGYITDTPEPFSSAPPESNPWHLNAGSAGGCCLVS